VEGRCEPQPSGGGVGTRAQRAYATQYTLESEHGDPLVIWRMDGNPRRNETAENSAHRAPEAPLPLAENGTENRGDAESDAHSDLDVEQLPGHDAAPAVEEDAFDSPDDPEFEAFSLNEAQLSPPESVPEDMGTIALERIPGRSRGSDPIPPLFLGGLASELDQMTDAEIMQRAGAGDDACFEFLVTKYRRPIIGFMYRMVHNQAVAEELAQEVFLRVYRARSSYRAEARFTTWLYRIAANMAINHARDTKHERASSSIYLDQIDEDTGARPDVADFRPLAEQDMLHDERMRRIREHVAALPERQRMAVVMHKYQDMDYKQIGAVLKLSESATKSLLFRAYQTLRERLKEFA
jgi:RNA polymerase sigma-70 factor (ECF subfamily)